MSLLGVIALVGIVVNNAIVLLEVVENRRTDGADVPTALEEAVARRIRPILLTTATTVAGLATAGCIVFHPVAAAGIGHDFRADLVHALDPGGGAGVVPGTPAFCESKGRQTAFIRVVDRTFIFQLQHFFLTVNCQKPSANSKDASLYAEWVENLFSVQARFFYYPTYDSI